MIRGVNRQIIEVNDTGSEYFEKALLFVRSEHTSRDRSELHAEASRLIAGLGRPPLLKRRHKIRRAVVLIAAAVIALFAVAALIVFA